MTKADEILDIVKKEGITTIRFLWTGNVLFSVVKASHADFLADHLETGIGICGAVHSTNTMNQSGGSFGGESPEIRIVPDLDTFALVPYAPKNGRFICQLHNSDMTPSDFHARYLLRRVLKQAEDMGFKPMVACEAEFYVFQINGDRLEPYLPIWDMEYGSPRSYDLSNFLIQEWLNALAKMNVKVERIIKELGHAQFEVTIRYDNALKAADDMVTLRDVTRGVAANHNLLTTFMPKPSKTLPGSGLHLHISLWDEKKNIFVDTEDIRGLGLNKTAYYFIGGVLKHMKALCPLGAPLINSYKRLLPGSWAPSHIFYGWNNRAAAIRIPMLDPGKPSSTRIEYRLPDGTANPYVAIASTIAAGLDGIRNETDPGEPLNKDPINLAQSEIEKLGLELIPRNLGEALSEMKNDRALRELLGAPFYDEYAKVRESEWKIYGEQVTEWEVKNYLTTF